MANAIAKVRSFAAAKSKQVAELRGPAHAAGNAGVMLFGAAAGGALDEMYDPEGESTQASTVAGVGIGVAGLFMKSPKMVYGAAGMLSGAARDAGKSLVQKVQEAQEGDE